MEEESLRKSFEKLIGWAHNHVFPTSWKSVFFVKATSIRPLSENDFSKDEIPREALFTYEEFEKYFDETLLNQGHSWINLHLLGLLENNLILTVEMPNYKNNAHFASVNLSLPESRIIKNNWDASPFYIFI